MQRTNLIVGTTLTKLQKHKKIETTSKEMIN